MFKRIILILALIVLKTGYGQNTVSEVEVTDVKNWEDFEVPFSVVDRVPIYKGCDETKSNGELKKCMSDNITEHVVKNFNSNVIKGLGFPDGPLRIITLFKVDKKGRIVGIKIRAPHENLEAETLRVLKSIPKFTKPGYQKGKPVIVPYALPILFNVDNSKPDKKKRRN